MRRSDEEEAARTRGMLMLSRAGWHGGARPRAAAAAAPRGRAARAEEL